MVNFKEIYHFSKFQRGVQHFPGGGGGGSNCLFPIETHITCDFPGGGSRPPVPPPPLDPYLKLFVLETLPNYQIMLRILNGYGMVNNANIVLE